MMLGAAAGRAGPSVVASAAAVAARRVAGISVPPNYKMAVTSLVTRGQTQLGSAAAAAAAATRTSAGAAGRRLLAEQRRAMSSATTGAGSAAGAAASAGAAVATGATRGGRNHLAAVRVGGRGSGGVVGRALRLPA